MKQQIIIFVILILVAGNVFAYRNGMGNSGEMMEQYIGSLPYEDISDSEKVSLLLMREEEKLARDVYDFLFERWGLRLFENISSAEQMHMNAVATILSKYNIPDPVTTDEPGVFSDSHLSELYIQLTETGNASLTDALLIGATIEDLDIFDLQNALLKADNMDILFVFGNLKKGSENHMRAFYSLLDYYNIVYKAQYISQEELEAIIEAGSDSQATVGRNW